MGICGCFFSVYFWCAHEGMSQFRCGGVIESFSFVFLSHFEKKKVLNNEEASWLVNDSP